MELLSRCGEVSGDFYFPFDTSPVALQGIWIIFIVRKLKNRRLRFSLTLQGTVPWSVYLLTASQGLIAPILQMSRLSLREVKSLVWGHATNTWCSRVGPRSPDPSSQLAPPLPPVPASSKDACVSERVGSPPRKKDYEELPLFHSNCPRVICPGEMRLREK